LFARADEVEASWALVQPVLDHWEAVKAAEFPNYAPDTWGPAAADELLARDGRAWRNFNIERPGSTESGAGGKA